MQTVLSQMNTLPGIVGSMVYDPEGQILAQAFPALFDAEALASAARILLYGASGLEVASGSISMLDFRFRDSRIVVRPFTGATLLLLCTAQANLQFLNISVGMAIPKIEKLAALPKPAASSPPVPDSKAPASQEIEGTAEKLQGFEKVFLKMDAWMRKKSGE
jgi:predicted regulator of Ras-like GTPase activity (Roadblock/LC7/MglB family)